LCSARECAVPAGITVPYEAVSIFPATLRIEQLPPQPAD